MIVKPQLAKLGLFDAKVPRYTSYPTAPHFSNDVGADLFGDWISGIKPGSAISLYIHVPFCRRLCWFCACRTQGTQTDNPVIAYVDVLKAELDLLAARLPKGVVLSRLHWGGGTPTLLNAQLMRELAQYILGIVPMGPDAEFSVEIDPNEIDEDRLDALAEAGMNRASIGVQDFDDEIQKTIGRIQSYDTTRDAIDMIRERGITSLNADILFGLPHQTKARMTESVQKLLSLSPDRVALYGYAHVPWMAKRQQMIPSDALPTPEQRLELFDTARRLFLWDNYAEIGIDHFAIQDDGLTRALHAGRLKRNFQGYTDDQADVLIGVGASSISRFPQGYAQNASATSAHAKAVRDGQFSTARGHLFKGQDILRARLIEALMCDFKINSAEILRDHDISAAALNDMYHSANAAFDGLLRITEDGLFIPPEARALTRMIARSFDAYDLSKAGHSSAI
ncbi:MULTISPECIES: oxygen-independent coproporphyrinogen III oxidase [unclassified Ruegeria]|uniref:oxygen-independent coproporphyrinogen III oxidase n=1 Tax=unclassified Ruegeria TaxID=2625375 RepID=UPI0014894660|nr:MULTISPECIES: oxygen-independent coproporphyrinogen III oxidase [unclassified Ruegeria]NOD32936.1 oxygen-independent coproporphyrinogen III oxidase [Ruegeria sp. HKCCD7296]NOD49113.1 oxygen-independent coproporphyrinogen III oxidase [Ruegeria sp. HKCCD5849]NOD51677.1 oxygen-independent coproporphyrinogen III oxidase [Ruegeria sp. HKCCD5851]NOD68663.1 oxygen-independent coproporphyrinogen III oxidase [Ruegeria sp. HKCCD7303]NOE34939.1 oxygen-independent coproporphyrinogen III oxidase [Rueger